MGKEEYLQVTYSNLVYNMWEENKIWDEFKELSMAYIVALYYTYVDLV